MTILVIGSGGREHALIWKLKQSSSVSEIFCAPGNGGIDAVASNISISESQITVLRDWALDQAIGFTIVGPELPLSLGIVDQFQEKGLAIFGVNQKAAQLESSKIFSKKFLKKYGIPTAKAEIFDTFEKAMQFLSKASYPLVLKADGLASGKGVHIVEDARQAEKIRAEPESTVASIVYNDR